MRLFRNRRAESAEARIAALEASLEEFKRVAESAEARIAAVQRASEVSSLEKLAREMISSIPLETNEMGIPDNKRRITEAFELARHWQEKRDA